MNIINRNTDYAIRALCWMGTHDERSATVEDIRHDLRLPRPILRSVLQTLARAGVLRSIRGRGGGFRLDRSLDAIFLIEIVEIFQGPVDLAQCFFRGNPCGNRTACRLRSAVKDIEAFARLRFSRITIASLIAYPPDEPPAETESL